MKRLITSYVLLTVLFGTVLSVFEWQYGVKINGLLTNTIYAISFIMVLSSRSYYMKLGFDSLFIILFFVSFIRGFFMAENMTHFKFLFLNLFGLSFLLFNIGSINDLKVLRNIYSLIVLPLTPLLLLMPSIVFGKVLMLSTLFYIVDKRNRIVWLFVLLVGILIDSESRGNVVRFLVPILLVTIFSFRFSSKIFNKKFFFFVSVLPFVFLVNGIISSKSVFQLMSGFYKAKGSFVEDTRTPLYYEVLNSSLQNNYVLFGRSLSRGNDTVLFSRNNRNERVRNEAEILNIYTWFGLVGVSLYAIAIVYSSYLGAFKAKSRVIQILGWYLLFRWLWSWIGEHSGFDMNYFTFATIYVLLISKRVLNMTESEIYNNLARN